MAHAIRPPRRILKGERLPRFRRGERPRPPAEIPEAVSDRPGDQVVNGRGDTLALLATVLAAGHFRRIPVMGRMR